MARGSTPESQLGRLNLAGDDSSRAASMAPVTRSQARRTRSLLTIGSGTLGSSGQPTFATAGPSRTLPPPDDNDSEDESSEEEEDDSDDESIPTALDGQARRNDGVLRIMSLFEPNHLTFIEMLNNEGHSDTSRLFRRLVRSVQGITRNDHDLTQLLRVVGSVPGPVWNRQTHENMARRARNVIYRYDAWARSPVPDAPGNAKETADAVFALFRAVDGLLRAFATFETMTNDDECRLVLVLVVMLGEVIVRSHDVRSQNGGRGIVYAGGVGGYEHNLFLRFASARVIDASCWDILHRHVSQHAATFRQHQHQVRFRNMMNHLHGVYERATGNPKTVVQTFRNRLGVFMQAMGMRMDG